MNDNVKKIFEMLSVEPNEKFTLQGDVWCEDTRQYFINDNLDVVSANEEDGSTPKLVTLLNKEYKIIKIPKTPSFKELMNWQPKNNETYFFVNQYGWITDDLYDDDVEDEDYQYLYKHSKIFQTREMATKSKEIQDKYQELGYHFSIKELQDASVRKYSICIDHPSKIVSWNYSTTLQHSKFTFKDEKSIEAFIEFLGENELEQYENACLYL